jgi:hypothetical protein
MLLNNQYKLCVFNHLKPILSPTTREGNYKDDKGNNVIIYNRHQRINNKETSAQHLMKPVCPYRGGRELDLRFDRLLNQRRTNQTAIKQTAKAQ